jgi:hypothetical protein
MRDEYYKEKKELEKTYQEFTELDGRKQGQSNTRKRKQSDEDGERGNSKRSK